MSNKQFISNLSATYADVRKLDVKKINLKGKNILEYIKDATPTVKHAQDTRETVTENDRWGQFIEIEADGTIVIHDDLVTNPNGFSNKAWNTSITKVESNKAYVGDAVWANVQTERIKDGFKMFYFCTNLESFTSDLSSLTFGEYMFYGTSLASFSSNLSSLTNSESMFSQCSNLKSFTSDLPSLTNGSEMFRGCSNLTSFNLDLSSLTNGSYMFNHCSNLGTFTSDLPSLTNGSGMFYGSSLSSFSSNLSSLTNSGSMFFQCSLTSFTSDLSSLINGSGMFNHCTNLESFTSDLSSLINGRYMFNECKLGAESVMYIADTIKDIAAEKQLHIAGAIPYVTYIAETQKYSAPRGFMEDGRYICTYHNPQPTTTPISDSFVGLLTLGINVSNNSSTIKQQLEDFAHEATFDSWDKLKTYFLDKGWTVTFQYGGTTDEIPNEFPNTYGLREGEQIIPCPIFAKLVEAEKDSAEYCTEDASTFYNIEWGHDVTDTSSYTQFNSLEDAMASWNVFPKENIITAEE